MARISKLGTNSLSEKALSGNLNFLSPIGFRFQLQRAPNVEYFCQSVTLPTLSINEVPQISPFVNIPRPGVKVTYGEFAIRFRIDEDMTNYLEIHDWIVSLGHPDDLSQFNSLNPMAPGARSEGLVSDVVSDGSIIVLSSNNNANMRISLQDMFPLSLAPLTFDTTLAEINYLEADCTFQYKKFEIEKL